MTRRRSLGVPVDDLDLAAIDKAALSEHILQRPIDVSQRGIAEYEPSDPEAGFCAEAEAGAARRTVMVRRNRRRFIMGARS
jgi:hypothetical protein